MTAYRGRHRAPAKHTGRRVAAAAMLAALPAAGVSPASAATPAGRWDPIIACESGGNPTAQNPTSTASGLFQFLDTTWREFKAPGDPQRAKDASVSAQFAAAERQFAVSGFTAWEASRACWQGKTNAPVFRVPTVPVRPPAVELVSEPRHALPPAAVTGSITVRRGDTLSELAVGHGVTVASLYERNRQVVGDNIDLIFPGQVLTL